MNQFDLLKPSFRKNEPSHKPYYPEAIEYRVGISVTIAVLLSIYTLDYFDLNLPSWGELLLGFIMIVGYGFAFISLFLSRNAGKVIISPHRIALKPKKNPEKYPSSPIYVNEETEINIYLMKSIQFGMQRTLLHFQVINGNRVSDFGMLLKNKQKHQQYYDVLESWYKAGFNINEFDQLGSRVFKLNEGKNYEDVQKIKQEYGLEWK
ncbi:hypothetical protein ACKGJO_07790 [Gracilimonas sp. Q87]|uniref:hypothetical protein n=1 Tax=Gracilimonas sp. Q87 TaxID=3384766 RepID=UPI003984413A